MEIRRIAGALGAEIHGVDLASLSEEDMRAIRKAWLEHLVVFFHHQPLPPAAYMAFARRVGTPVEYPFVKGIPGFPEIIEVKKLEHERVNFGGVWHSDTAYLERPPMASMLLAREIPPHGGDTLFANMYLAFESLGETLQKVLAGLRGVNDSSKADVTRTREDRIKTDGHEAPKPFVAEHPVVRTHPETGRKALYFDPGKILRIEGLEAAESDALIEELTERMIQPEGEYRHRWRKGDIVIWDNRCSYHKAAGDYPPEEDRIHWRVSIKEVA
jgi:taurine dioxygenase